MAWSKWSWRRWISVNRQLMDTFIYTIFSSSGLVFLTYSPIWCYEVAIYAVWNTLLSHWHDGCLRSRQSDGSLNISSCYCITCNWQPTRGNETHSITRHSYMHSSDCCLTRLMSSTLSHMRQAILPSAKDKPSLQVLHKVSSATLHLAIGAASDDVYWKARSRQGKYRKGLSWFLFVYIRFSFRSGTLYEYIII